MAAPVSLYRLIAAYPPYNEHLIKDIGAFQIGLGVCLALGLLVDDGLLAVLTGNAVGAAAHFANHLMDRGDGGRSSDPVSIGLLGVLLLILTVARLIAVRRPRESA